MLYFASVSKIPFWPIFVFVIPAELLPNALCVCVCANYLERQPMDLSSSPLNVKNIVGVEQSLTGKTTIRKFFFLLMLKEINHCNVCVCVSVMCEKRDRVLPHGYL